MNEFCTEYLKFLRDEEHVGKTSVYLVYNRKNNDLLGIIYWFGTWRKYVFECDGNLIFDSRCHYDIGRFLDVLDELMRERDGS